MSINQIKKPKTGTFHLRIRQNNVEFMPEKSEKVLNDDVIVTDRGPRDTELKSSDPSADVVGVASSEASSPGLREGIQNGVYS